MLIKKLAITVLAVAVLTTVTACSTRDDMDENTEGVRDEITDDSIDDSGKTTIDEENQLDIKLTIETKDILGTAYEDKLEQSLRDSGGVILSETSVKVKEGTTIDELLEQTLRENKIDMITEGEGIEKILRDIKGVANGLMGEFSGWVYTVNGKSVDKGIYEYKLKDGDKVKVYYSENTNILNPELASNQNSADSNLDMAE